MSIFRVFVDNQLFYHPYLSNLAITGAKVTEDAENIDSLTLSAPYNHPYVDLIKPISSTIVCKKDDTIVFEGRAIDDGTDFYNTHTWTCESCLSYLKDSLQEPYGYQGTIKGLLEFLIENHNQNVEDKKKFILGNITVIDNNDYIHYSNSEYSTTLDTIKDKLIKNYGGYLYVRYTDNGKVLDYLSDFDNFSIQTVEFGKNLLDVKINYDHTQRISALIPLGAKLENTEDRVNIKSVNNDTSYIFDKQTTDEIGWIWATEIWDNVTTPSILLQKAKQKLVTLTDGISSMELTIADSGISDIHARQYVECYSKPHKINGRYLCLNKTTDYLNPSNNTITIGTNNIKLTSISAKQSQNLNSFENTLLTQSAKIETFSKKADAISSIQENIKECYSEITKTSEQITSSVREEYTSKSEIETIKKDFETSISQTNSEIRLDFKSSIDVINNTVATNQLLLEEYIRFKGALIELGKVGSSFTAELSNEELSFKENGQKIAYISNQQLVITNTEIKNKLSLGNNYRGWFDFIPRETGNLSIKWRSITS